MAKCATTRFGLSVCEFLLAFCQLKCQASIYLWDKLIHSYDQYELKSANLKLPFVDSSKR
jgi:hypothetical protein